MVERRNKILDIFANLIMQKAAYMISYSNRRNLVYQGYVRVVFHQPCDQPREGWCSTNHASTQGGTCKATLQ